VKSCPELTTLHIQKNTQNVNETSQVIIIENDNCLFEGDDLLKVKKKTKTRVSS